MHRVIPDREGIHGGPQPPTRPLPGVRLDRPGNYQDDEIQADRNNNNKPALVGAVAEDGHGEDDQQGEERPHGGQGVGGDAVEAERPRNNVNTLLHSNSDSFSPFSSR